jgi:hypothetical protein
VGGRGAPDERKKEARQPDRRGLLPFELEDQWIEFGAGKERQDDRPDA